MTEPVQVVIGVSLEQLQKQHDTSFTQVIVDSPENLEALLKVAPRPLLVSTWDKDTLEALEASGRDDVAVQSLGFEVPVGINALTSIREILFSAYLEGHFSSTSRVLVAVRLRDAFDLTLFFDMAKDQSITRLKKELEYRADPRVIERILQLATEIAREGRERGHVGALFVVGDTDRVLDMSRQMVINPFFGHSEDDRNLLTGETWETAKEFSQIDGAFVIREDGLIEASGRYIEVKDPVSLPSGFGGRHLAAAHVTKETKAIAVTVSETGVIRAFKDGEILMRIGTT